MAQNDHEETIEQVRACDEERRRTDTEESVEDGHNSEKKDGTTENKTERRVPTKYNKCWIDIE